MKKTSIKKVKSPVKVKPENIDSIIREIKKEIEEVPVNNKQPEFLVSIKFNDKSFQFNTDDVARAILSVKPEFLRTSVAIQVTKNGKVADRYLYLNKGKMLFQNRCTLESFVKNLLF